MKKQMKKQIVIVIVAITLTAVLIAPTVMAFTVRDGNSVQYSSHRGLNYITDNSVTASNQPYITLSNGIEERKGSSRVKYYRAPVPVRTSKQSIIMGDGVIRESKSISKVSADAVLNDSSASMNKKPATNLDGTEWRVPEWRELGTITEVVGTCKIIKGTRDNPEQVIFYFETDDGKVHPVIMTHNRTIDLTW